jgi:DNA polymerase III epsilon subunit-like protein
MIILDIETTGLTHDCGICEIGAINLDEPFYPFVQNCRIDKEDTVTEGALKVNGMTLEKLRDITKQSQKELIENYLNWVGKQPQKIFSGQNVGWDISMIQARCLKYGLEKKFLSIHGQRGFDLHTIAQERYVEINNNYLLDELGRSKMNLGEVLKFCGLEDNRINVKGNEIVKDGNHHSALEDCKLEGEAFMRIKFGINLFPDYAKFKIPDYLKNDNI